ncbi:metal-dependent hydrolase family protein [Eudoraea chungangensis]|uniref:metal-dependent hydrolase family protein n=1 Tax=Eudoraea chungangensis TaxID=1481905 RepID=UPI0023EA83ED|nr:amidohydrolase family protein [Eudoraea chungangensis]
MKNKFCLLILSALFMSFGLNTYAQEDTISNILITKVDVFDGVNEKLMEDVDVLIQGNLIVNVSKGIEAPKNTLVIDGTAKTLIPGLIDNHWHVMFSGSSMADILGRDDFYVGMLATRQAEATLMRGFTTVRDLGGNSFSVKQAIDQKLYSGPRIYPSGAMISQTSGHADFRPANERAVGMCKHDFVTEKSGHLAVADGVPEVLFTVREQLKRGATQIKISAGGGTTSQYDPLDVTQFTFEEIKAAVDAAADWNTYVSAHVYTPKAVQRCIDAGVKVIEHGQLLDEETIKNMAEKDIWLSLQPFYVSSEDSPKLSKNPVTRAKQLEMVQGTATAYKLARKHGVKVAFGSDFILTPNEVEQQNTYVTLLESAFGYSPYEALKEVTSNNAELLKLSGPRNPYTKGVLGVIKEGAYADLIIVDGNPLKDLNLIADPKRNFEIIMKDGIIYKNTLK